MGNVENLPDGVVKRVGQLVMERDDARRSWPYYRGKGKLEQVRVEAKPLGKGAPRRLERGTCAGRRTGTVLERRTAGPLDLMLAFQKNRDFTQA